MMELNKYPFTESSTLVLTSQKYTMPLGLFLDANFYPRCANNPPYYVSDISKTSNNAVLTVRDNSGDTVFSIMLSLDRSGITGYCAGYGVQEGVYCGACLCTKAATDFFNDIPEMRDIGRDSLVFGAAAVRPISAGENNKTGSLMFEGKRVSTISWGEHLTGGTVDTNIIDIDTEKPSAINSIYINGVELTGEDLFITPVAGGVIRVANATEILIGRLTDI